MMRLTRVELRRLWWRRITWGACVLAVVAAAFAVFSQLGNAMPPSAEDRAWAEQAYAEQLEVWETDGEQQVEQCLEDQASDPSPDADYGCDDMAPLLENFLAPTIELFPSTEDREWMTEGMSATPADQQVAEIQSSFWNGWAGLPGATTSATFLLMIVLVVAVSFVTAEQGSGSLGMWLTFEPRRRPVYLSKALAAAIGTLPVLVGGWLLVVGGLYALYAAFGTVGDATPEAWGEVATYTGRLALAGIAVAAVGVALAVLLRNAAAAIGVTVAVLWITTVFGFFAGEVQRWLPTTNLTAWLNGGTTYGVSTPLTADDGTYYEEYVEHAVSQAQGGFYLLGVVLVLSVVALLVFRRRDVS